VLAENGVGQQKAALRGEIELDGEEKRPYCPTNQREDAYGKLWMETIMVLMTPLVNVRSAER
jgi:hypothetical protein